MATTKIGAMRIDITASTAQFKKATDDLRAKLSGIGKSFEAVGGKITSIGKKISVGVTAPLLAMGAAAIKGAQDQAAAMAQVDAAIASMGNAARLSSDDLSKFADQLELKSLFDADEILKKSTANLLTFGNVAGENFKKAQQAAVDLATRMDGDLQAATLMIGKALNDPVKGLTALSRAGIQFTDQQKEQIKTMQEAGNIAGAQAIMLGELNKQFGGAAAAAAKADPMREVMVKLGQAGDVIGEKLIPIIPVITDGLVKVIDAFTALSPATQEWVVIGSGLAAALGPVVLGIGGMVSGIGALLPLLAPVLIALAPIAGPLALIAAGATAVYIAWKKWPEIVGFAKDLYEGVKTWLADKLNAIWERVMQPIRAVKKAFYDLYDSVVGHSYIPDLVDGIRDQFARLDTVMVIPAAQAIGRVDTAFDTGALSISEAWDGMARNVLDSTGRLVQGIKSGGLLNVLGGVLDIATTLGGLGVFGSKVKANIQGGASPASLPGLATGGAIKVGGLAGLDRNILSLNSQPIARVNRGEHLYVDPRRDGSDQRATVMKFDLRGAVMTQDLLNQMNAMADGAAMRGASAGAAAAVKYAARKQRNSLLR